MKKSIKVMVGIRIIAALVSMLLFSGMTTVNTINIDRSKDVRTQTTMLLERTQFAEVAHYKWLTNLSNALYTGSEFTGSIDPTTCVLGQWVYGEADTDNAEVLSLRSDIEPLHKALHESATKVLETYKTDPKAAQEFFQTEIEANLGTLLNKLDRIIEISTKLNEEAAKKMDSTIAVMHIATIVCLTLALVCLINLILYITRKVVNPLMAITKSAEVMREGRLRLDISYSSSDEVGRLIDTLKSSLSQIENCVSDINSVMAQLSSGNFDVRTGTAYLGDFQSIQTSIESFTDTMSATLSHITNAERRISDNAEQLSANSQSLAQGATEQASATQQLYASLDELYKSAQKNT